MVLARYKVSQIVVRRAFLPMADREHCVITFCRCGHKEITI